MKYPKHPYPYLSWPQVLDQYGDDDFTTYCIIYSGDPRIELFGRLLDEMRKLDNADLSLVRKYQDDLLKCAIVEDDDLTVSEEDLIFDARRLLAANGVDY